MIGETQSDYQGIMRLLIFLSLAAVVPAANAGMVQIIVVLDVRRTAKLPLVSPNNTSLTLRPLSEFTQCVVNTVRVVA